MRTISDLKNSKRLSELAKNASKKTLEVGFFETARYPDGTSVAGVAAANEFGNPSGGVPSRPFFRNAIAENDRWQKPIGEAMAAVTKGKLTLDAAFNQLGLLISADVKQSVTDGDYAPISQATIAGRMARKTQGVDNALKSDASNPKLLAKKKEKIASGVATKPLIDTGQLLQSVTYNVTG